MPDPRRLGKYEIHDTLGKGAMGTVYRGFDPYIERSVAIKTINKELVEPDLVAQFLARFRNEAKAAGRLHHPNIVGIYEYGEDEAVAFIAMEYVEGTGLREYVRCRSGFDFGQLVALMSQLLGALEYAHGAGVVHRDIKPANLIVTVDGVLKVTDFGIARVDLTNLTATGVIVGTPSYMSPEQCRGREAEASSDLFSAGVVLYELLTGEKPFQGPAEAIAYKICHEEPEAPSQLSALKPPAAIDYVVALALAKDPARRFATARAFNHALREVAHGSALDGDSDATRTPAAIASSPVRAAGVAPNNLPQQLTSFVGRERALAKVKELLSNARLLTLLGVGGLGKTRLALQVGSDTLDKYRDGVWLVELAPLSDARLVPQAAASVLGVKEEAGRSVLDALVKHVASRQLLLILDNCEHLLHACADLAKHLLQAGPRAKVLTTSREVLHVAGENSYPVPTLTVPDQLQPVSPEALSRCEAVRLFVDRAVATQPTFQLTIQNASAVADICHRLDGIPLALELAAARVRTLSVEAIAQRLGDRFRLLKGGDQTALPRQQTLRAMIDWSYDLLTPDERTLLRRLAVFAGGWTLEGAEIVGAGGEIDAADVLDLLSPLVEKSLVVLDADGKRYGLLETVRQYATDRLAESGEGDATGMRHLQFYLALAEEADPKLFGSEQELWFSRLALERENLLAAHAWCNHAQDRAQAGLRLAHALRLWFYRGALELGHRLAVEALAREGAQQRNLVRCRTLFTAGSITYFMGRYAETRGFAEESLAIARETGDTLGVADGLVLLGAAYLGQEDRTSARGYLAEALALSRELNDTVRLSQAVGNLAELHYADGDLDAAQPLYEEALMIARNRGDREGTAIHLLNLARIWVDRGAGTRAQEMLQVALVIIEEFGSAQAHQLFAVSAGLAAYREDWPRAARFFGAAATQLEQRGLHREPADEAFLAPLIARTREATGAAQFAAEEAAGRALGYEGALAEARSWLAAPR